MWCRVSLFVVVACTLARADAAPSLYIECSGVGSPLVVLEAGASQTSDFKLSSLS